MKPAFFFLLATLTVCSSSYGQTLALTSNLNQPATRFLASDPGYSSMANPAFLSRHHKPRNKKLLAGGILSLGGGVLILTGGAMYALGAPSDDPYSRNTGLQNTGAAVAAVGGAVLITGIILAIMGKNEKNRGMYGLELVAPYKNEIGIAYNF